MTNRRDIKFQVAKRITANRQRVEDARAREEQEAAALRELNQKTKEQAVKQA